MHQPGDWKKRRNAKIYIQVNIYKSKRKEKETSKQSWLNPIQQDCGQTTVCSSFHSIPSGAKTHSNPNPAGWPCQHPLVLTDTAGRQQGRAPKTRPRETTAARYYANYVWMHWRTVTSHVQWKASGGDALQPYWPSYQRRAWLPAAMLATINQVGVRTKRKFWTRRAVYTGGRMKRCPWLGSAPAKQSGGSLRTPHSSRQPSGISGKHNHTCCFVHKKYSPSDEVFKFLV